MATTAAPRRRMSSEDSLALWREYKASGDRRTRDRLVLTFAPLVKYIVYKKVREMPARCEVEDFISCGLEALIQSIDRYDPEKGATDRKSTRLNSSHANISYAVFCLKKK